MNCHVNAIAGRLSLRLPQRCSLEILDRITEIAPPGKSIDILWANFRRETGPQFTELKLRDTQSFFSLLP